jgi:hypothetical protein
MYLPLNLGGSRLLMISTPLKVFCCYPMGNCQFTGGAYHVSAPDEGYVNYCLALRSDFSNFAYEVQMKIIQGNCGGIVFRYKKTNSGVFYYFEVCQNGMYALWKSYDVRLIGYTFSPAIHIGHNQSNLIAVVANDSTFDLYVNHHKIDRVNDNDNTYRQGEIAVEATYRTDPDVAYRAGPPSEVVFSNAKVWT